MGYNLSLSRSQGFVMGCDLHPSYGPATRVGGISRARRLTWTFCETIFVNKASHGGAMHDYQLERLNTRSFEQLIQALGTEIIGPQLMIFGDGPDGGREATFEGSTKYPPTEKYWSGYGIVQAKFRQQPDSEAKKNADWAIQQLKSEFAKLKPRPKGKQLSRERICPEYYIFATNLALSAVVRKGGKDRVRTLLDGFKKSHGLKGYAIWDGDQIRRFLDAQPGIRTTYTAWLLPGDVLAEMMKVLQLEQTNFPSTIRRYLESELLDDQFARLGQGGYTDAKNIPLSCVFVDLPVEPPDNLYATLLRQPRTNAGKKERTKKAGQEVPCTFLSLFFEEGRQILKPSAIQRQVSRQMREGKHQDGRLVLIGGPGQGKTTVGQFGCQLLRAALLRSTDGPFSPEVSQALERIEEMSDGLPPVNARRYPLRVDLKHLAAALMTTGDDRAKSLFDYLSKRIASRTNSIVSQEDFRRWLSSYPWVLVLDGLDEVPASSNRQQVMEAIRDFVGIEAPSVDADLLVLATTRPQGYSDEFDPMFYRHLPLAPLNTEQALAYGLRLATARHPGQPTRVDELTASLTRATTNPATARLMQSPLQVTIMLALIEGGGEPPEQRWKLFHDYYDVIYRREKERGTAYSAILGRYEPDIHWVHHRAGWLLQLSNAGAGSTDARLTHEDFERIVDQRLRNSGHEDDRERLKLVKTIRQAATDRLVLLVGNTEEAIGFEIRSLQEFMAAEHFFDGGELCVQQSLHVIAPFPYWRNVFLFAAGRIFFERQELTDTIIAVCSGMNDTPTDQAQQMILSGSRLALALLKDGTARNQPASIRILARCGSRSLDVCDFEGALAFAELFSSEAETVWQEELAKRLTSGPAFPYQNWFLCLQLVGMGKSWAQQLMKLHFPWEGEHTHKFISMLFPDYIARVPETFWTELAEHIFSLPPHIFSRLLRNDDRNTNFLRGHIEPFIPLLEHNDSVINWPFSCCNNSEALTLRIPGGQECLSIWAGLHYPKIPLSTSHYEWHIWQAVSVFARKPTKENLAEQLRTILAIVPDSQSVLKSWHYPWQIIVCLTARNAGRPWDEIISCVEAGNLGDEDDWIRWEEENKRGIELSKFRLPADFSISNERLGLILLDAGWSFSISEDVVRQFAEALSRALDQWPEIRPQKGLIDLCCYALHRCRSNSGAMGQSIARFINTCFEYEITITTPALAAVLFGPFPISEKRKLLAKAGACPIQKGWLANWEGREPEAAEFLKAILEELLSNEEWGNVLRAISFLPPLDAMRQIPTTFLEQLRLKGEAYSKAATSLKINSLRWEVCESTEVVREALSIKENYPDHLWQLFTFIDSKGKSGPHLEGFLVELIKHCSFDLDLEQLNRANELLVKLVERRPAISQLPDPAIRQVHNL